MQKYKVNYITHLNTVMKYFNLDDRLNVNHIGFYMFLFQKWNSSTFKNPIPIYRDDLLTISQLGSRTTYLKILNHLTECGYIIYIPSKNPQMPSRVYMFNFCTSPVLVLGSYINYINLLNNNYIKGKNWIQEQKKPNKDGSSCLTTCSYFEQVLYQSQNQLLAELNVKHEQPKRSVQRKKTKTLYPTGQQPTPDADYSEPL